MNAHQRIEPQELEKKKRKRRSYDSQSKANQKLVAEMTIKLTINTVLTIAAIASLTKLLPYHLSQEAKLQEVRDEIQDTQKRVDELSEKFTYYFDSRQSQSIINKYSLKVEPNERRIFWIMKEKGINQ